MPSHLETNDTKESASNFLKNLIAFSLNKSRADNRIGRRGGTRWGRSGAGCQERNHDDPHRCASSGGDPVAQGLVASFLRPGGNLTGFSNLAPELAWRRLELVQETIPNLTRVAFLWSSLVADPSNPGASRLEETQNAAKALGLRLLSLDVRTPDQLPSAFESAVKERTGALIVPAYMIGTYSYRTQITDFSIKKRMPVSCDASNM